MTRASDSTRTTGVAPNRIGRRRFLTTLGTAAAGSAGLGLAAPREAWMPPAEGATRGGTLRVALDTDPPTLDPHLSGSYVDRQVYQNLFDKLVDTDEHLRIVPMLATAWTISADGKTATFKLRQGVTFHDGTPFDAEAAVYNFQRMLFDPTFPSVRRSELRPVKSVVAVDAHTIRLSMDQPYSPLLYVLTDRAGMMVSPAAARTAGVNFARHPVGTGPFAFADRVVNDHITLRRNPHYWATGLPYLDEVLYRPFTDDAARVANLKAGSVDMVTLVPLPQVPGLVKEAAQPGATFRLIERSPIAWTAISLNVTKPPFDNKALRQAFNATIDRGTIAKNVLQGTVYPAYSFFPNGTPAYDPGRQIPPRNIPLAKEKLKAAGRAGGFSFTVITVPGQQFQAVLEAVQSMAADAGIKMQIKVEEAGVLISDIAHLNDQAALITWSGRPDPDFDIYPFVTKSGIGSFNYAGYTGSDVQQLLDQARIPSDMAKRRQLYRQVTTILADDAPFIWLYFPKEYKLVSKRVRGFRDQPDGMARLRGVWLSG